MTEHSICHPGRPLPHGDSHSGSPGLEAFQRAKSFGDLLPDALVDREPSPSAIKSACPLFHGCNLA